MHVPQSHGVTTLAVASMSGTSAGDDALGDTIPDRAGPDPGPVFGADWWDGILSCLPPRHQVVMRLRFHDELELRAIGERLGISHQRVEQIARYGLKKLRKLKADLAELID